MTTVPTPRFDLLKMKRYAFGSLQFSRGCPFQCEFCDIIVTFGRRPRIKTSAQVLAELEAIRKTGQRIVFIVDDNLIGNKKAIKEVLGDVIAWQERKGYPLTLFTEASIDLADDPELLDLMVEANFIATFIGIESPSEESLRETKKFQNVRQGGTLLEKVQRIQTAGIEVWCGMIMGFDSDDCGDLRPPDRVHPGRPDLLLDERDAQRHPQDAAPRAAGPRGPARPGRSSRVRHQRDPAPDRAARSCSTATSACSASSTSPRPTSRGPTPCSSIRRSRSASPRSVGGGGSRRGG